MGLLKNVFSGESPEIRELRDKIKDFEKGFERRQDYDDLQSASLCYLEISLQHPEEGKQNMAFMSGRNALEKAITEANIEMIKPEVIERAVAVYEQKGKQVFLRPLFDAYTQGLKRFLDRMSTATLKQLTREKITLQAALDSYKALAAKAGNQDAAWFEQELSNMEKEKSDSTFRGTPKTLHRTFGAHAA